MRYSVSHKQQTRDKLLHSSAALAKKEGFASVGGDGLMKAIGLSGGAFYSHFSSKDALFSSIVEHELSQSLAWAILSQCVGALVVARMMVDPQVQAQVLASSYEELSQRISQE